MTKRLVDIDDALLQEAAAVLGTSTMKETVNRALAEARDAALRRRHLQRLVDARGTDLADRRVMDGAWR